MILARFPNIKKEEKGKANPAIQKPLALTLLLFLIIAA
jgi:hypothetical protein